MYASLRGYKQCVNDLMCAGADVNTTDIAGVTALMYAAENGHYPCVNKFITIRS